jgi:hypothetical protein
MLLLIILLILLFGGGGFWLPQRLLRTEGNGLGKHPAYRPGHVSRDRRRLQRARTRNIFSVILALYPTTKRTMW